MVQRAISFLKQNGKLFGYHMKSTKGALLLGKRDSARGTGHSFNSYRDLQLNESTIHVHPDDFVLIRGELQELELPTRLRNENYDAQKAYGFKALGSFIGSDEFIKDNLDSVLEQWKYAKDKLIQHPVAQQRYLLFKYCFAQTGSYFTNLFTSTNLSNFKKKFSSHCLSITLTMSLWICCRCLLKREVLDFSIVATFTLLLLALLRSLVSQTIDKLFSICWLSPDISM